MTLRQRWNEWMRGRYGVDQYSKVLVWSAVIISLINILVTKSSGLNLVALGILFYGYFRIFSRQITKRSMENAAFLRKTLSIRKAFRNLKRRTLGENGFKYFECESCKTELRVPKNKGKIKVRCPKCKHETIIRT